MGTGGMGDMGGLLGMLGWEDVGCKVGFGGEWGALGVTEGVMWCFGNGEGVDGRVDVRGVAVRGEEVEVLDEMAERWRRIWMGRSEGRRCQRRMCVIRGVI